MCKVKLLYLCHTKETFLRLHIYAITCRKTCISKLKKREIFIPSLPCTCCTWIPWYFEKDIAMIVRIGITLKQVFSCRYWYSDLVATSQWDSHRKIWWWYTYILQGSSQGRLRRGKWISTYADPPWLMVNWFKEKNFQNNASLSHMWHNLMLLLWYYITKTKIVFLVSKVWNEIIKTLPKLLVCDKNNFTFATIMF